MKFSEHEKEMKISRQALEQRRNVANGMCGTHKNRPIFSSPYCEECYRKKMAYQRKRLKIKRPYGSKLLGEKRRDSK